MSEARKFDVVVYGATGFTGKLVAEYIANARALEPARWALAGRNTEKLEAVRADLVKIDERLAALALLRASADEPATLAAMAEKTKVVLTTVGPYIRYGVPLVDACVTAKTNYVDITGEPEFVSDIEARYDERAKNAKIKIVTCCGFDSIPHDLGVLYTVEQMKPVTTLEVNGYVWANGSFSGGTWNSAVDAFARFRNQKKPSAKATSDRRIGSSDKKVHYVDGMKRWAAPMPTIDPVIVKKSARLLESYGSSFRYGHFMTVKSLPVLAGIGAAVGGAFAIAQLPPGAALLRKLKSSGDGPSPEERARSRFSVTFYAEGDGKHCKTRVSGGDPGYTETAMMISESAFCLALDDGLPEHYGVTTTAAAMGTRLVDRLVEAGLHFETLP